MKISFRPSFRCFSILLLSKTQFFIPKFWIWLIYFMRAFKFFIKLLFLEMHKVSFFFWKRKIFNSHLTTSKIILSHIRGDKSKKYFINICYWFSILILWILFMKLGIIILTINKISVISTFFPSNFF